MYTSWLLHSKIFVKSISWISLNGSYEAILALHTSNHASNILDTISDIFPFLFGHFLRWQFRHSTPHTYLNSTNKRIETRNKMFCTYVGMKFSMGFTKKSKNKFLLCLTKIKYPKYFWPQVNPNSLCIP